MSDNTNVSLVVLKDHFEQNKSLFESVGTFNVSNIDDALGLIYLQFYDINYGNLEIEDELQDLRIPYDKDWDAGDEYPAGCECFRVLSDGACVLKQFSSEEQGTVNINDAIRAYEAGNIATFLAEQKNNKTTLGWHEQKTIIDGREAARKHLLALPLNEIVALFAQFGCDTSTSAISSLSESNEWVYQLINKGFLPDNVARYEAPAFKLKENNKLKFAISDSACEVDDLVTGKVIVTDAGIEVEFDQYESMTGSSPLFVDFYEGNLKVAVWSSVNQECPTHIVSLNDCKVKQDDVTLQEE